jgi:hypothetical protein
MGLARGTLGTLTEVPCLSGRACVNLDGARTFAHNRILPAMDPPDSVCRIATVHGADSSSDAIAEGPIQVRGRGGRI